MAGARARRARQEAPRVGDGLHAPLPSTSANTYRFTTTATPDVDEATIDGDVLFVEYEVACNNDDCATSLPACDLAVDDGASGTTSSATSTFVAPDDVSSCVVDVSIKNTDFDSFDEYVISTTVNGVAIHGKCTPLSLSTGIDEDGYFKCATGVALPQADGNTYYFVTDATPQVANRRRPPPARRTIKAAALASIETGNGLPYEIGSLRTSHCGGNVHNLPQDRSEAHV